MDSVTRERRSEIMSRVRSKDTGPERVVRRLIHGMGYRYGLHRRDLPGTPDLVFPSRVKVIFINGCFWHGHKCALGQRMPKSRRDFWVPKIDGNRRRDARKKGALRRMGWGVLTVWECQLTALERLKNKIRRFLDA